MEYFLYLLINFWEDRIQANKGALKAVIYNKIGDILFLLAIIILILAWNNLDIAISILNFNNSYSNIFFLSYKTMFCIGISVAAIIKSAQIGFHDWLLEAMEGPTPVSALLHSSTMVTAGIFLLITTKEIIFTEKIITSLLLIIGLSTSIFSAIAILHNSDVKKIIAFSTMSNLGIMFCSLGVYNHVICFFHLINHGFFKSILFMSYGVKTHFSIFRQDLRSIQNELVHKKSVNRIFCFFSILSSISIPFSGVYESKDIFIEIYEEIYFLNTDLILVMLFFLTTLSFIYSVTINEDSIEIYNKKKEHFEKKKTEFLFLIPLLIIAIVISGLIIDFFLIHDNFFFSDVKIIIMNVNIFLGLILIYFFNNIFVEYINIFNKKNTNLSDIFFKVKIFILFNYLTFYKEFFFFFLEKYFVNKLFTNKITLFYTFLSKEITNINKIESNIYTLAKTIFIILLLFFFLCHFIFYLPLDILFWLLIIKEKKKENEKHTNIFCR